MFFSLATWQLVLVLAVVIAGFTAAGLAGGRYLRHHSDTLREPFGVLQAAVLGIVGLLLAFSLSLAVGRYEGRRATVVDEANAIGTTYLRAQTLREPVRTQSIDLLRDYADQAIALANTVPGSAAARRVSASEGVLQRRLWSLAGTALTRDPVASAPRLYVDSLNTMIDQQTVRVASLNNRVPNTVLWLDVLASAAALGLLAIFLSFVGRGQITVVLAAVLVTMLLFVTFDLDRPARGLITVPDRPLRATRASMALPPAAEGPPAIVRS